ncbi:MAG: Lytic transglycosylase catalytic [Pedosphaera sp.]|nr:Lytic transglycosylase catalytic [Pedosphaera sp.]
MPVVKALLAILFLLILSGPLMAQENPPDRNGGDALQSLNSWMEENLDDNVLNALQQIDQDRIREIFTALQQRFQGTNILELGSFREAADHALPVLQQFEETRPYAVWLQTHLDYFDASEELRRQSKPSARSGASLVPPAPPLKLQRQVWVQELSHRPWPPLAQTYVPRLKEIFIAEKLPPQLVWVAEVESSFDPSARSPAGAAGMFQLMPQTARAQKLSLWPCDERLQPEKSAHASARYLRYLRDHYNGDWQLALAAYNAGEARIDKLLKQHKVHTFDAIARRLPAETQMYVPKIEATIQKREGLTLAELKAQKI